MLKATDQERQEIIEYVSSQVRDETVELAQKVYSERVALTLPHDIWDVHTRRGRKQCRWWVITNPTNLYTQEQFPNMDLALTFHVGLCLRVPRSDRPTVDKLQVEPFVACWRALDETSGAVDQVEEVEDCQAIGVRCREALITLIHIAQDLIEIPQSQARPKKADFRAWSELIADVVLPGPSHRERRGLLKSSAEIAWSFTNWLTHARSAHVHDAQAAFASTQLAMSLLTTALICHVRGVPQRCPSCGSQRLSPQRAFDPNEPHGLHERPACQKCDWKGTPVLVALPPPPERPSHPEGECIFMNPPLRDGGRMRRGQLR